MGTELDRRSFMKLAGAVAAVVLAPLALFTRPWDSPGRQTLGFRFAHDESVAIILDFADRADRYDVTVRRHGVDVEFFPNADPMRLHRLGSQLFEVEYFDPVAA
jgi:hypothetical protein